MTGILREHTAEAIRYVEISPKDNIVAILRKLLEEVTMADVVLCPWAIPGNAIVDGMFSDLSERCWVVAAAGNSGEPVENWTPARADGVIAVGTLNKSGAKATLSNFSGKVKWVTGTNYRFEGHQHSGTSISAALYAAFLAESIGAKDGSRLDTLIKERADEARQELV
jgi:hypothetical protein